MKVELDHIAVVVSEMGKGLEFYRDLLGLKLHATHEVPDQKVEISMMEAADGSRIELLKATAPDSPVAKYIAKKGEGLHHLAFTVENLEEALNRFKEAGARLIDREPRIGAGGTRIAFIHPQAASGVLIELVERGKS